ncbi:Hsp70 family protein [Parafrankia sp. FMc2]|uniref:Hsp70 family protein n=1 Tax=Parafrankia sp. FMc2 TaxID=3233196 RepID=UPI0034D44F71
MSSEENAAVIAAVTQGVGWRLRRKVGKVEAAFRTDLRTEKDLRQAATLYGEVVRAAVEARPALALCLFRCFDTRLPAESYPLAFRPDDEGWLRRLADQEDQDALRLVMGLSARLSLHAPLVAARDRLAGLLGRHEDAGKLVGQLLAWQDMRLLDVRVLETVVRDHLRHSSLEQNAAAWSDLFAHLPVALLPDIFEVRLFLDRGADAVRLADTPARQQTALECCLRSGQLGEVIAGLELAEQVASTLAPVLHGRAGELLFDAGRYAEALPHHQAAGHAGRASECHERLGDIGAALAACPAGEPDRLIRLAGLRLPQIDELVERRDLDEALRQVDELVHHLDRARVSTAGLTACREEISRQRAAIMATGRRHFADRVREAAAADRSAAFQSWSRFEEAAGAWTEAAGRAEDAGDRYRAHRLYCRAGQFGQADRVIEDERSPEALATRAASLETGGDLVAAARLFEEAGRFEEATGLFIAAGDFTAAAGCLVRWRGDEALEDPRLIDCLRRTGDIEQLVRRCLQAAEADGASEAADVTGRGRPAGSSAAAGTPARSAGLGTDELRRLRADALVPSYLLPEVDAVLAAADRTARRPFEARAAQWVATARGETDQRFAGIWGFDLGTTTCTAAIYDRRTEQVVLCRAQGETQFPSTLSLDSAGNELVGLRGEEILGGRIRGHISGSKRRMGTRQTYRIRDRSYRPEEVAARLIRHARGLVEGHLADQVRERVGELARAALGEVRDEWLTWAERNHDLRITREQVVVTIPAYFRNNQKRATRDACRIAGVQAVRLIHEPTAACMSVARQRRLTGGVVVVDLGAGTLDVSLVEVNEDLYEVHRVLGDNNYGGNELDEAVTEALSVRLRGDGIPVEPKSTARRRLAVAAEHLKVCLSSQDHAEYWLPGLVDNRDVRVDLDRDSLAAVLDKPLSRLRDICRTFRSTLVDDPKISARPDHLVLIGGPMLSPQVRGMVAEAFGLKPTVVADPRTAVASGAAIQGAVLAGVLREQVLLDVTPLPLGIRAMEKDQATFSVVIDPNTRIPVERKETYSTYSDNQTAINVEIFNGDLDASARIGQFRLSDITPLPRGVPQIEVTFAIDANCLLTVTAHDLGTGRRQSIQVDDATLLSPAELDTMARRREEQEERIHRQTMVAELRNQLHELVIEAEQDDAVALLAEFRDRLATFRPTSEARDPQTETLLAEMFNPISRMELERELAETAETLRDLVVNAKDHLGQETAASAVDPAPLQHLTSRLERELDRLRPLLGRLTQYNAALVRFAVTAVDPLRLFRERHAAGDHAHALAVLGAGTPDQPEDVERLLQCLAAVGDTSRYRQLLADSADRLPVRPARPLGPGSSLEAESFHREIGLAQVAVAGTHAGKIQVLGGGFLISAWLAVTSRHWLVDHAGGRPEDLDPTRVTIVSAAGTHRVEDVLLPDAPHCDVALLRLAEAAQVPPLRLGYPNLAHIGDQIAAVTAAAGGEARTVSRGIIERFETFPEQRLRVVRTSLAVPSTDSGNPLFNDLGEVIGVLTIGGMPTATGAATATGEAAPGVFALSVEILDPLLERAGFSRLTAGTGASGTSGTPATDT